MKENKLSCESLLSTISSKFSRIEDYRAWRGRNGIKLHDALMSGLALFSLKSPSLLSFNNTSSDPTVSANLKNLYSIERVPSDTQMREILNNVVALSDKVAKTQRVEGNRQASRISVKQGEPKFLFA